MPKEPMKIATIARALRMARFGSAEQLADAAAVDSIRYGRFEKGGAGAKLKPAEIERLAAALGVAAEALADKDGRPAPLERSETE